MNPASKTIEQRSVAYFRQHFNRDDRLAIALINPKTNYIKHEFRTAEQIVQPAYQAHLRAANAQGLNVYATVNTLRPGSTGRTKADVDEVRHVFLDIDANGREVLNKVLSAREMPQPHSILETSPGKFQMLWSVEGFQKDQAEAMTQNLAQHFGADQAVWDSARVLRVPGFRNTKYEQPHFVKDLVSASERPDRIYKPEDFPAYKIEREVPVFGSRAAGESSRAAAGGMSQSDKDWAYVNRRLEAGDPPQEIIRSVADYRRAQGNKAYPESYAKRTVEKAMRVNAFKVSRPMSLPSRSASSQERIR
jgi:hypothetical protein